MPITVIPAPDNSGAQLGLQYIMQALGEVRARRNMEDKNYAQLATVLADKNLNEDQQALLIKAAKENKKMYGKHDLDKLIKTVARPIQPGQADDTPDFVGPRQANTQLKDVAIERPQGTLEEQQNIASIASTQQGTAASKQSTEASIATQSQNAAAFRMNNKQLIQDAMKNYAYSEGPKKGQPLSLNDATDYLRNDTTTVKATPRTKSQIEHEDMAIALGAPSDEAGNMQRAMLRDELTKSGLSLDVLRKSIENNRVDTEYKQKMLDMLKQGINPSTGKPFAAGAEVDAKEISLLSDRVTDALGQILGRGLGAISEGGSANVGVASFSELFTTVKKRAWSDILAKDVKTSNGSLFFGSADPVAIRADIDKITGISKQQKVRSVKLLMPGKGGLPELQDVPIDKAIPLLANIRSQMGGVVTQLVALGQSSPRTLLALAGVNPTVREIIRYSDSELSKLVTDTIKKEKESDDLSTEEPWKKVLREALAAEQAKQ